MRELNTTEMPAVQGGIVITTAIITGVVGVVVGSIWLTNSLVNLYLYKRTGSMPSPNIDLHPVQSVQLQSS